MTDPGLANSEDYLQPPSQSTPPPRPSTPDEDYASKPPPIPSPSSPSYSYYLQAVEESSMVERDIYSDDYTGMEISDILRRPSVSSRRRIRRRRSSGSINNSEVENDETSNNDNNRTTTNSLKEVVFTFLNPKQHLILSLCRDIPLFSCLYNMLTYFWEAVKLRNDSQENPIYSMDLIINNQPEEYNKIVLANLLNTRASEYFLAGMWCGVSAFMIYSILDGLIVRWIVIYSIPAAIVRMVSMSLFLSAVIKVTLLICNPSDLYLVHTWIFISCILTFAFIIQNFFVHNLNDRFIERRLENNNNNDDNEYDETTNEILRNNDSSILRNLLSGNLQLIRSSRYFNYYNIVIYAVMPIGVASFITMTISLRNILILKVDVETLYRRS